MTIDLILFRDHIGGSIHMEPPVSPSLRFSRFPCQHTNRSYDRDRLAIRDAR